MLSEQLRKTEESPSGAGGSPIPQRMKPLKESGTAPVVHRRSGKIAKVSKLFSAVSHSRSTKGDDERDEDTPPTFEADIFETNYPDADRSHSDETETNTDADDLSARSISTLTPENERE